eukprot:656414-Amphidinium_carterae.5
MGNAVGLLHHHLEAQKNAFQGPTKAPVVPLESRLQTAIVLHLYAILARCTDTHVLWLPQVTMKEAFSPRCPFLVDTARPERQRCEVVSDYVDCEVNNCVELSSCVVLSDYVDCEVNNCAELKNCVVLSDYVDQSIKKRCTVVCGHNEKEDLRKSDERDVDV